MPIKNFLFILIFMIGFILYSIFMWGLVIANITINAYDIQTTLHPIVFGILITIINPMSTLVFISQLKLGFNKGIPENHNNISTIWGSILLPIMFLPIILLLLIFIN